MSEVEYFGIHVTTIAGKTSIVGVVETHDGGMVEFFDPITGDNRGCAGINWWREEKHHVPYDGPLPTPPDPWRWRT